MMREREREREKIIKKEVLFFLKNALAVKKKFTSTCALGCTWLPFEY